MIAYGEKKRGHKLHDYDRCEVCSEKNPPNKKWARREGKKQIREQISGEDWLPPFDKYWFFNNL